MKARLVGAATAVLLALGGVAVTAQPSAANHDAEPPCSGGDVLAERRPGQQHPATADLPNRVCVPDDGQPHWYWDSNRSIGTYYCSPKALRGPSAVCNPDGHTTQQEISAKNFGKIYDAYHAAEQANRQNGSGAVAVARAANSVCAQTYGGSCPSELLIPTTPAGICAQFGASGHPIVGGYICP